MIATAPGKLVLTGEYAVLEGHVAVVAAVNRRVIAHLADGPQTLSPFLAALEHRVPPEAVGHVQRAVVDSTALCEGGAKLGLGSSAATVVAACALALGTDDPDKILAIAHPAHGDAQSPNRGSGIDVAASCYGGVIAVRRSGIAPVDVTPLKLPEGLTWVAIWTGIPADTRHFVAAVEKHKNVGDVREALLTIAAASRAFIDACASESPEAAVCALALGADGIALLSQGASVPAMVPPQFRALRARAAALGGAAKTSGAGGGDVLITAFPSPGAADRFRREVADSGHSPLDLCIDSNGVLLQ